MTEGINRYIMECKFKRIRGRSMALVELIDTLWNVNITDNAPELSLLVN